MTRLRLLTIGAAIAVLLTGCTGSPTGSETSSPTPTAGVTATASPEPVAPAEPESVFAVSCDDMTADMNEFAGATGRVNEVLGLVSSPNWYPGPAQFMTQRAGGVVCSYDGEVEPSGGTEGWRIMIVPGAQAIIDALVVAGYEETLSECNEGTCTLMARSEEALLVGEAHSASLAADHTEEVRRLAQQWVEAAAATQQPNFTVAESAIAGVECEQLLAQDQLAALWDVDVYLTDEFGGWSVPAQVYSVVNGGALCAYRSGEGGEYGGDSLVFLTDLPGGEWAFDSGRETTPISVLGADAAHSGTDESPSAEPYIDILVEGDWIRLTGSSDAPDRDLAAVAAAVAANVAALH